jgi:hypothetical protein
MFREIQDPTHWSSLIISSKLNPPHAGKVLEGSWNLLGIIQEWKQTSTKQGWMRHKIAVIVRPIKQGDRH